MTRRFPDLGSSSDWLKQISHTAQPIRNTTQIWVVARHQYGVFALFSQTLGLGETRPVTRGVHGVRSHPPPPTGPKGPHFDTQYPS